MIKNSLSILLLLLVLSESTHAQGIKSAATAHQPIGINFGLKLGVNLNKLDGVSWDNGYQTNLLGGAFAGIRGGKIGVKMEGLFNQSQYVTGNDFYSIYHQYYTNSIDSLKKGHFRANYLSIPVLLEIKVVGKLWLQLGVQYSGLVSVKDNDALLKDAKGLFKTGSIAGIGGLTLQYNKHINLGARYVLPTNNINNVNTTDSWKDHAIQLHIGYSF